MTGEDIRHAIRQKALSLGFDVFAVTRPSAGAHARERLEAFISSNHHGDMGWMATRMDERADPLKLWPEAKSVLVVGHNYGPEEDPMLALERTDEGIISCYARGEDYHDVIKKKLRVLGQWLTATYACDAKLFVDTAPVMEKPLAERAGLGWQGKHTCIVSREFGSWLFLGELFTTLELEPDAPAENRCGSCSRCVDVCPTRAFTQSGVLDARKCISYLTIEHKGHIPLEFRKPMGNRIYGCDDCLAVCPWNKYAQVASESAYHARGGQGHHRLNELLQLDDAAFRALFRKSPVKRTGRDRFIRNVLIAAGNSADANLLPHVRQLLADASAMVRGSAVWALSQLAPQQEYYTLYESYFAHEQDAQVKGEWQHGRDRYVHQGLLPVLREGKAAA